MKIGKMKHRKSLYICFAFLAFAVLGGCQKEQDAPDTGRPSDQICFSTSLGAINASAVTKSEGECLLMESEDWVLEPATRVTPTTTLSGTAGVIAYKDDATSPVTELSDESFTFADEILSPTDSPIPWSKASGASILHVFSYAPYNAVHAGSPAATINTATASPTLSYTVPDNVNNHMDLIAASANVASVSFGTSVPLTFDHVLTAVRFKVDFACKVKSLSVNGVYKSGTYTIGGDWSGQSTTQNYTFSTGLFTASGTNYAAEDFLIDGSNTLMLMPQTVPAGATVVLNYSTDGGETYQDLTASIAGHEWQKGKRITYTISKTGVSYIYFDLAAGPVSITGDTYSGYVYVNGVATNVSGDSPSEHKYYIYQSTTITGSNDKDHTGYANSTDFANKENIRLPAYVDLISGGLPWNEFITNNTDIASVINGWISATSGSRTGTNNTITVNGNVTADITMDNLWCSFHDNSGHRLNGGILIGPGTKTVGKRYEKVTLRLKGDNRFCNIYYYGHPNTQVEEGHAYLHVTSASGDGSHDGTLTVTVPSTDIQLAGACTVFGSGDNDDSPPCNSFVFNGGTIYVAGSILVRASDSTGILGGGTNNHCNMVINEAVITAVAYSNGAAIGGGGGYSSGGGSGTVTINAGKVYAYQNGSYDESRHLSTAAIGGGSSYSSPGSSGNVIINGGEVYAQSVGGVAIGGGSSYAVNGGSANVVVNGGSVIAKSISGTINGHAVTAGNSIGGGKGGSGLTTGYGGSATVTLSGGTLLAGSIGGGGTISESASIGTAVVNINGDAVVQGQIIMADGADIPPVFTMEGGTLRPNNLGGASFEFVKLDGGAVYIEDGSFAMSGGVIRGVSARNGGAVYMEHGTFTMTGGTIVDCSADYYGGAVYIGDGAVTISGTAVIDDCIAANDGGAIYMSGGNVTISNGTISNNRSNTASGGGVYVDNGSFSMAAGTIIGNYAAINGGGVSVSSSSQNVSVSITGGTITENSSGNNGGGLSVVPGGGYAATVNLGVPSQGWLNPAIFDNSATHSGGGVFASGADAAITIDSGKILGNSVSAIVANPDVANVGGLVTLNDGDVTHVVVTYHMNDGSIPETTATQKLVTATRGVLSMPSWSIGGYSHTWNSSPDGSGTSYTNGQEVNLTTGLHLYAIWTAN